MVDNNVIDFDEKRREKEPHTEGKAFCIGCGHEWEAWAPLHVDWLECPKCKVIKGQFKYHYGPDDDEFIWRCTCENTVFIITPYYFLCPNCGIRKLREDKA